MRRFTVSQIDLMTDLICLQKGIIHYSVCTSEERGSIDAAFSSLTTEEARRVRRKFRKIVRNQTRCTGDSPEGKRSAVMEKMRNLAWKFVTDKRADNDV
jgi:hypothetical protein